MNLYCIKCQRITGNSSTIELKHDKDTVIRLYYIIVFICGYKTNVDSEHLIRYSKKVKRRKTVSCI